MRSTSTPASISAHAKSRAFFSAGTKRLVTDLRGGERLIIKVVEEAEGRALNPAHHPKPQDASRSTVAVRERMQGLVRDVNPISVNMPERHVAGIGQKPVKSCHYLRPATRRNVVADPYIKVGVIADNCVRLSGRNKANHVLFS